MELTSLPEGMRAFVYVNTDGCWLWLGHTNGSGYVRVTVDGKRQYLHRYLWARFNGPIPAGYAVDHECHDPATCPGGICEHRRCANPDHMKAKPAPENSVLGRSVKHFARKTHCPAGHPYDEANTRVHEGRRFCHACKLAYQRRWRARRRAAT